MKRTGLFTLLLAFAFVLTAAGTSYAKPCKTCLLKKKGYGHSDSLKDKFFGKAHFFLKHQDELDLSDDQVNRIKALKLKVKKEVVMKKAEIKVAKLDIKAKLKEDKPDVQAVNVLIDKKYELKKAKAKLLAQSYLEVKSVLTNNQMEKAKEVWKMKKEEKKEMYKNYHKK